MSQPSYEGRCHCGAIGFTYRTAMPGERWSIRTCQCTFCRLHDALSTSDPQGGLEFSIREPRQLQRAIVSAVAPPIFCCAGTAASTWARR